MDNKLVVENQNERQSAWRFIAGDGREIFNFGRKIVVCQVWLEHALSILKEDLVESLGYSPHDWSIIASWIIAGVLSTLQSAWRSNVFPPTDNPGRRESTRILNDERLNGSRVLNWIGANSTAG